MHGMLLQTFPILCSTWTTTSSTGKALTRGSCTACDPLQSRSCSVQSWDHTVRGRPPPSCWCVSLPASPASQSASQPAKGPPRLHSPASVARRASTCPSTQKPQKDFLTGGCSSQARQMRTVTKRTRTYSIFLNFSCLSGIRSVAGQVTWLRERERALVGLLEKHPSSDYYMGTPICLWSCCFE